MPKITITRRRFPESDCNAVWTAVIDGVPTFEYSKRDWALWARTFGAPRSNAYHPITYMGPREFVRLSDRQLVSIIRSHVDEGLSFVRCCEQINE